MAEFAPGLACFNSPLSRRYGPANIPLELGAENGLFQPNLILAEKDSPKWTPRLGRMWAEASNGPLIPPVQTA